MMQAATAATERLFNFGPPFPIPVIRRAAHVIAATGTVGRQPERLRGDALDFVSGFCPSAIGNNRPQLVYV